MKKITGFFMAILPFFVLVLLFISGLVIKSNTTVHVSSVNIVQDDFARKVDNFDDIKQSTFELEVRVYPTNANNPEVYWKSADDSILEVDDFGSVKAKKYGETYIYAQSKEDTTKVDSVKIEIYDDKIHDINIANSYQLSYVGLNQQTKIEVDITPANHIIDKTLIYKSDNIDVLDVTADGWILPKKEGKANVTVTCASKPTISKTVEVNIGKGVDRIEFNNQATTFIDSQFYDLRNEIVTYPEQDKTIITSNDFEYETSDSEIAEVVSNYIVFKKQEPVSVSATYKRNPSLKISKTLHSTCNDTLSVNFDANQYEVTLDTKQVDDKYVYVEKEIENLNLNIFPNSNNLLKNLDIESSNKNVVEPIFDYSTSKWKMIAKKPGMATLLATVKSGEGANPYCFDACLVKVLSPTQGPESPDYAIIKEKQINLPNGMYYYPLCNALSLDPTNKQSQSITFRIIDGDAAEIDANNILQFSKNGTVTIKVYVDGESTSSTFTVTASQGLQELTYFEGKTLTIKVGQRYKFTNATPIFEGSYASKFNVDNNEFSAKCGQNIPEFKIKDSSGNEKTIKLIVSEKPITISHDVDTYYSTSQVELNFFDLANASIIPSTALKENGEPYKLNYVYTPETESTASVKDNVITFKQPGLVDVVIECQDISKLIVFKVKSTYGNLDKFDVYDDSTKISSNYTKKVKPNEEFNLTVSGLTKSEAEQIQVESVSDTKICESSVLISGGLLRGYTATINIKSNNDVYGIESFRIFTKTYSTYINVEVASEIQDFNLMYNHTLLKSGLEETNKNLSFTQNLDLDVLIYPLVSNELTYTTKLDGQEIPHTNNKISLESLSYTKHTLEFSWTASGEEKTKSFVIDCTDDVSQLNIKISEADAKNLYLGSNDTTKTFHLTTNGFVSKDFFSSASFSAKLKNTPSAKVEAKSNVLSISGFPKADGTEYSDDLVLTLNSEEIDTYTITRDIVSKIVLPKHDNNSPNDKKGYQKVHVYGNLSYYNTKEGLIDFYKLPVKIYDYKGDEIVNSDKTPNAKTNAMKTLLLDIGKNCSATYDPTNDYIKVKFSTESLYDENEIANNEFDAKNGNKNVLFDICTKSKNADAKYTFIAVKGVNVYDQQGIILIDKDKIKEKGYENPSRTAVFQVNFGLEEGSKENAKYETDVAWIPGIYGNGYTLNLNWIFKHHIDWSNFRYTFIINANIKGCYDEEFKKAQYNDANFIWFETANKKGMFVYSSYSNFLTSMYSSKPGNDLDVKNSIFYNNMNGGLHIVKDGDRANIENTIFFDCGGFAIQLESGSLYFKGYVGIYNFHSKEMLKNVGGADISFLWGPVEAAAKLQSMCEIGADGRNYINSFLVSYFTNEIYFWNNTTKQYEQGVKGTPDAANFVAKYISLAIPLTRINLNLWATYNTTVSPDAFSYYQEFDNEGNIRPEFFRKQVDKITRRPNFI